MPATAARQGAPGVRVEWLDANRQQLDVGRTDVAGFIGIAERGPLHVPAKIESMRQFVTMFGAHIERGCLAYAVEGYFANGGRTCWVVRVANPSATAARQLLTLPNGDTALFEAVSRGKWGERIELEPLWNRDSIVGLTAREEGRPPQIILFPGAAAPSTGFQTSFIGQDDFAAGAEDMVLSELAQEQLVRHRIVGPATGSISVFSMGRLHLENGSDGLDTLEPAHFCGDPAGIKTWGIDALSRVDNVSFVAAPDLAFTGFNGGQLLAAQIDILSRCVARRDRIALLDLPRFRQNEALAYAGRTPNNLNLPDESFGAVYHPWIRVDDPLQLRGNTREIPPSGHVAGMFARTDRLRGVHKPPGNEVLEGVWDVFESIDDDAHARLNGERINAIRAIPGRGIRVLGARTLSIVAEWRYINVRRLFSMIEEGLDEQLQWLVFEPNNPRLWRDIDRAVRGFLERLFRAGMLDGESSDDAYFVRCDATTNPPEITELGKVCCEIGVQPPWPAEFVIVRIGVTRSGIEVEEKGAQDV